MENNIDTIKMTREIREKHYQTIQKKSKKEIIEFFRKKAKETNKKEK